VALDKVARRADIKNGTSKGRGHRGHLSKHNHLGGHVNFLVRIMCIVGILSLSTHGIAAQGGISAEQTALLKSLAAQIGTNESISLHTSNSSIRDALASQTLRSEVRKAIESMKVDSEGRPTKFELFGKTYLPTFDGNRLVGFTVDGSGVLLSISTNAAEPQSATIFYREENGQVKSTSRINPSFFTSGRISLAPELELSKDAANSIALENLKQSAPTHKSGVTGWDNWLAPAPPPVPCYVCDSHHNSEVGICLGGGGVFAGAVIAAASAACVGTLGVVCIAAIAGAAVALALDYNLVEMCIQSYREKYFECRGS
jgi:hypothetical protein